MRLISDELPSASFENFIRDCGGWAIIDGGLGTELEKRGADLNDPLWSAKCLVESPELVTSVHLDYLEAGANIIISASYQATLQGFEEQGISEGESLLRKSVKLACDARDLYYDKMASSGSLKLQPVLVAASIGSYGAYLADGSEYRGDYGDGIGLNDLKEFHRRRVQILAASGADLIAFETIPNKLEAEAYAELLNEVEMKDVSAWFSFTSGDGVNVVSGDSIEECALVADSCDRVVGIGINCSSPRFVDGLIRSIKTVTKKPILVYPNSGETYNAQTKQWMESTGDDLDFVSSVEKWREAGATLIGGCCRTTPSTIRAISKLLSSRST